MAINNLSDLLKLQQQLGYYQSGGGKPPEGTQIGEALTNTGQGLDAINQGIQLGQKTAQGQIFLDNLRNQLRQNQQQMAPISTYLSTKRINPDTPSFMAPEIAKISAIENPTKLYANPNDFTDVSVTPDAVHTYAVSEKEGLNLGVKNPTVAVKTSENYLQEGHKKKNDYVVTPMQQGVNPYADMKDRQYILSTLPSRSPVGSQPAQAATIQLSARQLKALIATPGAYQRLGLAKGDVARMVLRSAPQEEVLKDAGFSNTFINSLNVLKQKISSDPSAIDQPLIRKELYDIGTHLEESSRPIIERSLNETERSYNGKLPLDWAKTRSEELGEKFPDIPFRATEDVVVDDSKAMKWAIAHPLDPRAQRILKVQKR